jgi:hypothetical protein
MLDDVEHHDDIEGPLPIEKLGVNLSPKDVEPAPLAMTDRVAAQLEPHAVEPRLRLLQKETIRTANFEELAAGGAATA